jgi:DNA polymerase III subunit alpha
MMYIPLKNHTPYSLLQGAIRLDQLMGFCQKHQIPAVGLADSQHLFGAMEFSQAALKKKIHPLLGVQVALKLGNGVPSPISLYAQDQTGWQQLCHLVTVSTVGQPIELRGCLTPDQLVGHTQGLLALTGGNSGPFSQALPSSDPCLVTEACAFFENLFPNRFYVEIERCSYRPLVEDFLIRWAYEKNIPLIATNQAFFLEPQDFEAHDVLRCVALGRYVQEVDRPRESKECYLKTPQEMQRWFHDIPEALQNTFHLMKRCAFALESQPPCLPLFPGVDSQEEALRKEAVSGLEERLKKEVFPQHSERDHERLKTQYRERLEYEMAMIIKMGFAGYFLIVSDFIRWAKSQKIPVGPGRGSGASSLVAWTLSITDVDPIRFDLFFERFLNPERVSLPDFDVDFCQERRDEVIAYVAQKYGAAHVAHIITFGTLQARAVLRDVGRVLQMPYMQVDKICKMIPAKPGIDLAEALRIEPQLTLMAREDSDIAQLLEFGKKLEGLYRHASTHAAGVIISKNPLTNTLPLYQDLNSLLPATEFSMKYAEAAGLIKFDFLGLKTLTVLKLTTDWIEKRSPPLDLLNISLEDPATFKLLCRAETVGLFQLESLGMTEVLKQIQPERFEEIIALVALYRPGPMDDIPRYVACKHQREVIHYPYSCLEEVLKESFGVMVYQEQVLQIARKLAGYTLGEADLLRRAMGKKIPAEMDLQRNKFIEGVQTHNDEGQDVEVARQLFDQIAKFAGYAFPKAHATPYALLSYQTAYLKANYPVEFLCALMTLDVQHTDKLYLFSQEVRRMKIPLLPVSINSSEVYFSVEAVDDQIQGLRYALCGVKNVGEGVMKELITERQAYGPFQNVFDFVRRLPSLNKKSLESLIYAGALDEFQISRATLIASLELLLRYGGDKESFGDLSSQLFEIQEQQPELKSATPWTVYEQLEYERQALGFYFSQHPLEGKLPAHVSFFESLSRRIPDQGKTEETLVGIVMDFKERVSKAGKKFAWIQCSDPSNSFEVLCFSETLQKLRPLLVVGQALFLRLQVKREGDQLRLMLEDARPFSPEKQLLQIKVADEERLFQLFQLLKERPEGIYRVTLHVVMLSQKAIFRLNRSFDFSEADLKIIRNFLIEGS